MTPDGISAEDWDRVRELAAEVANATTEDEDEAAEQRRRVIALLDELEAKYGVLPSILATKAEYSDDVLSGLALLERAFSLAVTRGDSMNQMLTSSSIAQVYIEELNDAGKGRHWLDVLRTCLDRAPDDFEKQEWQRLSEVLAALEQPE